MFYIILIMVLLLSDQWIKNRIEQRRKLHQKEEILRGNIIITKYYNKGAFLGLLKDKQKLLERINVIAIGVMIVYLIKLILGKGSTLSKLSLSLIIGGALSNVYDRIQRKYVIDYFSFKGLKKVVFNMGDMFIFLGSIMLLFYKNK
ncbi:signal peptidase II [Natranaerovirga hydrolytica]|uniref:Lipoprotein signal peptidase n=1 Tax=Natranaerovirga hydrolytica TaxID=680378 RepID=A0A4R1N6A9_9FIRM|nr:signal peptidase II [Natranaerovirga hydrolytica]TCK98559.1 signal peptidase II [Natranaerovirga hydrolytica]